MNKRWHGDMVPIDISDLLVIPGMAKIVSIVRRETQDDPGVQELCDEFDDLLKRQK